MHSNKFDLVVVVRVNTECALRCSFCGYSRDLERSVLEIDGDKLTNFGKILQKFQVDRNQRILMLFACLIKSRLASMDWQKVTIICVTILACLIA